MEERNKIIDKGVFPNTNNVVVVTGLFNTEEQTRITRKSLSKKWSIQ